MRSIFVAGAALAVVMLLSVPASAFEIDSPDPVGDLGSTFDFNVDHGRPKAGTVLERFADTHDGNKPGTLQVFGSNLPGTYGIPNSIPGPASSTPSWFYSTPSFRGAR